MFSFDINRFSNSQLSRPHWVRESSHESYVRNYSIVFPNDEPLAGRDASHDALHQELIDDGAVMQARAGWERPGFFIPGEKVTMTCSRFIQLLLHIFFPVIFKIIVKV